MKNEISLSASFGLSQQDMALLLGISRGQLSMYEIGKRSLPLSALQKLASITQHLQTAQNKKTTAADKTWQEAYKKKLLRENGIEQYQVRQKIEQLQKKQTAQEQLMGLADFIQQSKTEDRFGVHQRVTTKVQAVNRAQHDQKLAELTLRLEVLKVVKDFLEGEGWDYRHI